MLICFCYKFTNFICLLWVLFINFGYNNNPHFLLFCFTDSLRHNYRYQTSFTKQSYIKVPIINESKNYPIVNNKK